MYESDVAPVAGPHRVHVRPKHAKNTPKARCAQRTEPLLANFVIHAVDRLLSHLQPARQAPIRKIQCVTHSGVERSSMTEAPKSTLKARASAENTLDGVFLSILVDPCKGATTLQLYARKSGLSGTYTSLDVEAPSERAIRSADSLRNFAGPPCNVY